MFTRTLLNVTLYMHCPPRPYMPTTCITDCRSQTNTWNRTHLWGTHRRNYGDQKAVLKGPTSGYIRNIHIQGPQHRKLVWQPDDKHSLRLHPRKRKHTSTPGGAKSKKKLPEVRKHVTNLCVLSRQWGWRQYTRPNAYVRCNICWQTRQRLLVYNTRNVKFQVGLEEWVHACFPYQIRQFWG